MLGQHEDHGVPVLQEVTAKVRHLTLNEDTDQFGRLIQKLGTNVKTGQTPGPPPPVTPLFGMDYIVTPTEVTTDGAYEIWEIANLTGDTHPIHFHLVNVQVLARAPFNPSTYTGTAIPSGNIIPPDCQRTGLEGNGQDEPWPDHLGSHEVRCPEGSLQGAVPPRGSMPTV